MKVCVAVRDIFTVFWLSYINMETGKWLDSAPETLSNDLAQGDGCVCLCAHACRWEKWYASSFLPIILFINNLCYAFYLKLWKLGNLVIK